MAERMSTTTRRGLNSSTAQSRQFRQNLLVYLYNSSNTLVFVAPLPLIMYRHQRRPNINQFDWISKGAWLRGYYWKMKIPHPLDGHNAIDSLLMAYGMVIWHPTISR